MLFNFDLNSHNKPDLRPKRLPYTPVLFLQKPPLIQAIYKIRHQFIIFSNYHHMTHATAAYFKYVVYFL